MSSTKSCSFASGVAHLARFTSAPSGMDAGLMLAQYGSPLVAATLLALVRKIKESGRSNKDLAGVIAVAAGLVKAGTSIGEARTVTRLLGLPPMVDWLLKLHPNPLKTLASVLLNPTKLSLNITNDRVYATLRVIFLIGYYIGEHTAWLASKGVVPLSPTQAGTVMTWAIRFWAVDVFMSVIQLLRKFAALKARSRELGPVVPSTGGGYEVSEKSDSATVDSQRAQLQKDWSSWEQQAMINFGYLPLTVQWSSVVPGGVWTNPLITLSLGSIVAVGKCIGAWRATV